MCYNHAVAERAPLATTLAGIELASPLIAAAGTCGYVEELASVAGLGGLGAVTTKSITKEVREGNAPSRVVPTKVGMLNAIGLANIGLAAFLEQEVPKVRTSPVPVIASVAGHGIDEFVAVAAALGSLGEFAAIELNVSCPNTATGRSFSSDATSLGEVVAAVRAALPSARLFVKLPPDMADPCAMARTAISAGASALVLCNTLPAMAIDVQTRQPRLSRRTGGLSGPAIHPLVVRVVDEVYRGVAREARVPIIGLGGVSSWEDAAELILAGAAAVGVGTATLADPRAPRRIARGLDSWVTGQRCTHVAQLVGQVGA